VCYSGENTMSAGDMLWEELWLDEADTILFLQCVMDKDKMSFAICQEDGQLAMQFARLEQATHWLTTEGFTHDTFDEEAIPPKISRRLTPQQKKRLSYERDTRTVPTGQGASRRVKQLIPKLRRRQLRHRLKAYLQRELNTIFRDISDQSLRSIHAEEMPHYEEELPLHDALEEKKRRKREGKKTTRAYQPPPPRHERRFKSRSDEHDTDLPDWLRNEM
jgi:hypothetical protein